MIFYDIRLSVLPGFYMEQAGRKMEPPDTQCAAAIYFMEFFVLHGLCDRQPSAMDDGCGGQRSDSL